jgi:hypothetical protein
VLVALWGQWLELGGRQSCGRHGLGALLLALGLSGCAYQGGQIDLHYQAYKVDLPRNDKISVCSAYGCRTQTAFRFNREDIARLKALMAASPKGDSAENERKAVAVTLAWMEQRVGDVVGTSADRPGDDLQGVGDPTQMDCVDVATNLTSYLLILERHQLLRHHSVGPVYVKEDLRRGFSGWTHYAAILVETKTTHRYAVDGWLLASGTAPEIVAAEQWYINDTDVVFGSKPAAGAQAIGKTSSPSIAPK